MNLHDLLPVTLLLLMMAVSLPALFGLPIEVMIILLILYVVVLSAFSFVHGAQTLGKKEIVVFFCITALVTYLMEWFGTHFGVPFGHYYYTNRLGATLMEVPLTIPFQWFNILYASYIMSQVLVSGLRKREDQAEEGQLLSKAYPRMIITSIIVGLFMVSWDFVNDPYMVGAGMWVWTDPGEFFGLMLFGIPLSNFLGWVLTGAIAVLVFELYGHLSNRLPRDSVATHTESGKLLALVPYVYVYIFQALSGLGSGVFSLMSKEGWGPIVLAAIGGGIATIATGWGYLQTQSQCRRS
jgi:uncharacterized membrane protein